MTETDFQRLFPKEYARLRELEQAAVDIGGIGGTPDRFDPIKAVTIIADLRQRLQKLESEHGKT